jgi:hypothetical protein
MPRKKSEFKPLTTKGILAINPERRNLSGSKKQFEEVIKKALHTLPFDKKRREQ